MRLSVLAIPVGKDDFLLHQPEVPDPEDHLDANAGLPVGWRGCVSPTGAIDYDGTRLDRGFEPLRLYEHRRYLWTWSGSGEAHSSLEAGPSGWLARRVRGGLQGDIEVSGFLGNAWLSAGGHKIRFDVTTSKLDYETQYHAMLVDIAEECQQLLLDWRSPTSVRMSTDPLKVARLLLERFLFVRSLVSGGFVSSWLEEIRRNPDTRLSQEVEWQPYGQSEATDYLRDPFARGRDWSRRFSPERLIPQELRRTRRRADPDTMATRFDKHVLEEFRQVASEVLTAGLDGVGPTATVEAQALLDELDSLLGDPFFSDVGRLERVPLECQLLQKRDGYRLVLGAWLNVESASQLDWAGREDFYDGTTRNASRQSSRNWRTRACGWSPSRTRLAVTSTPLI